jgi:hypothetical protein
MLHIENKPNELTTRDPDTVSKTDIVCDLMIAIFQEANSIWDWEDVADKAQYVKCCASDIDRLGRVLKFLGLAEDEKQSVLGWKPTAQLIRIIARRAARPTKASEKYVTKRERAIIQSLLQLAGGWVETVYSEDFVFTVLNSFGLLRESVHGECKPTALLREMLGETFGP